MIDVFADMSRWFSRPAPRPAARLRLFCLPYAGGGTAPFRPWVEHLPDDIELCLVQLPGRETRMREVPYTAVDDLVSDLTESLEPLLDRPFAVFGHSMGALIAFALTRRLADAGLPPERLLVSARRAPHIPDLDAPLHQLPDAAFVVGLVRRYNGIPKAILQDIDLLKLFLPTLRADLTMIETYRHTERPPLDVPISAFGGWEDTRATPADISGWRDLTRASFTLQMFPGGHFYINEQRTALLTAIGDALRDVSGDHLAAAPDGPQQVTATAAVTAFVSGNDD
jgi:surfactin synthase thioesterase subunit